MKIKTNNKLPEPILDAINDNNLIIFIGAGISRAIGYPSWSELGNEMIEIAYDKKIIDKKEKELLLNDNYKSIEKISIIASLLDEYDGCGLKTICSLLKIDNYDKDKLNIIAECLSYFNSPIITTNADLSLDKTRFFNRSNNYDNLDNISRNINFKGIVHIHGSINKPKEMIFTAKQYADKYSPDSDFGKYLQYFFSKNRNKIILFIGYSISEFELIRYFIKNRNENHIYILREYYSYEISKYKFDKEYYKSFGMKIIPYLLDTNKYDELLNVIKKWKKQISKETTAFLIPKERLIQITKSKPNTYLLNELIAIYSQLNIKDFVSILLKSEYKEEWITKLLNKNKLFSPIYNKQTFIYDKTNKQNEFYGLSLLYAISDTNNYTVVKKIKSVLAKSYKLITELNEKELNYSTVEMILEISCKKPEYIKSVNILKLIRIYLENMSYSSYEILKLLKNNKIIAENVNKKELLEIYMQILKIDNEIDENYYYSETLDNLIKDFPSSVLYLSVSRITKLKNHLFDLDTLATYKKQYNFENINIILYFLNTSIRNLSEDELIEKYLEFSNSTDWIINKIGMLMMCLRNNLHFHIIDKKIYENKKTYQDIVYFLKNNDIYLYKKAIAKNINNSNFGNNNESNIILLRKNLNNILENKTIYRFDKQDQEYVDNYGKTSYSCEIDKIEPEEIAKELENIKYINIEKYKKKHGYDNLFYEYEWNEAVALYLLNNGGKVLLENIDRIIINKNTNIIETINYQMCNKKYKENFVRYIIVTELERINDINESFLKSLLFIFNHYKIINTKIFKKLLNIKIEKYSENIGLDDIGLLINDNLFLYLEILFNACDTKEKAKLLLEKVNNINTPNIDLDLALLYTKIVNISNNISMKISEIINYNVQDLNYSKFGLTGYYGVDYSTLDQMCKYKKFIDFLIKNDSIYRNSQENYLSRIVYEYLFNNKYDELVLIILDNLTYYNVCCIARNIAYFKESKHRKVNSFIEMFTNSIKTKLKDLKNEDSTNLFNSIFSINSNKNNLNYIFDLYNLITLNCKDYLISENSISSIDVLAKLDINKALVIINNIIKNCGNYEYANRKQVLHIYNTLLETDISKDIKRRLYVLLIKKDNSFKNDITC